MNKLHLAPATNCLKSSSLAILA